MAPFQIIAGILLAFALGALLARRAMIAHARNRAVPSRLFGDAASVLEGSEIGHGETAGSYTLDGRYDGHAVQVKALTDTLALRKLPSLWLMVTIPEPLPVNAVFDLMMRPAGPTTFSNFDLLPHALPRPAGFPEDSVIRTDHPSLVLDPMLVAGHLGEFLGNGGKELLITPKGLRMVTLLAEASRVRYGVFRQADFGDAPLAPENLRHIVQALLALRADIMNSDGEPS